MNNQTIIINKILSDISAERQRQNKKWGEQNHNPIEWIGILTEEVGEASKEAVDLHFKNYLSKVKEYNYSQREKRIAVIKKERKECLKRYRNEVLQIAAVAIQMLECFDRNHTNEIYKTIEE